jgi:hypothetical protein
MREIRRTTLCDANGSVSFRPADHVSQLQAYFDAFVEYVAERLPEQAARFRRAVEEKFHALTPNGGCEAGGSELDSLQHARRAYVLMLLGIPDTHQREAQVTRFAGTQSRLYPMYYQVLALSELIGRQEAIPLVEAFVDRWMAEQTTPDLSLEDPGRFWDDLEGSVQQTSQVAARIQRGKIAFRVSECLWANVMRPLGDPDLSHTFTCYGDFSQVPAIHPDFVLTRTVTVMQDGPYCDTCIHDRRFVDEIVHPDREFFDALETEQ